MKSDDILKELLGAIRDLDRAMQSDHIIESIAQARNVIRWGQQLQLKLDGVIK